MAESGSQNRNNWPKYALGVAFSGGGFRGLAHIGVLRVLIDRGWKPDFVAGTSAGSLIAALYASGKSIDEIEALAYRLFWPGLLTSKGLRSFCSRFLPPTFAELALPLRVAVTQLPDWKPVIIESGDLAPVLEASCAMPWLLRRVRIGPTLYTDGGWGCVLPAVACRPDCGKVVGSDVWFRSSAARKLGFNLHGRAARRVYSQHYLDAVAQCDFVVSPAVPFLGMAPNRRGIARMIKSGASAAEKALAELQIPAPVMRPQTVL